jgi:N-glycosylase/DNA lyase
MALREIKVRNFSLKHSLECGQFFRYRKIEGFYYVNSCDKLFKVKQRGNCILFNGVSEGFIRRFFRLGDNYRGIIQMINKDNLIDKAIKKYDGLRLINQDPWECLVSYVCSSAANIPKIKINLELLSKEFGKKTRGGECVYYAFPEIGSINNLKKIVKAKTGFRCRYILDINRKVDDRYLKSLRKLPYDKAKEELIKLPGVGEKVANCVLLYSLNFLDAFPIDVWIRKIMRKYYFHSRKVSDSEIRRFARDYFGKYAGYAQQYLYYYARNFLETL